MPKQGLYILTTKGDKFNTGKVRIFDGQTQKIIASEINRYVQIPVELPLVGLGVVSYYIMDNGILVVGYGMDRVRTNSESIGVVLQRPEYYFIDFNKDE